MEEISEVSSNNISEKINTYRERSNKQIGSSTGGCVIGEHHLQSFLQYLKCIGTYTKLLILVKRGIKDFVITQ